MDRPLPAAPGLLGVAAVRPRTGPPVLVGWSAAGGGTGPLPPAALAGGADRLVWWRAPTTAPVLVGAGVRLASCWDLGAVARVLHGTRRDDPAAVWAGSDAAASAAPGSGDTLLDLAPDPDPVRADGSLSPDWSGEPWASGGRGSPAEAQRWAALALQVQGRQALALAALPDPRPAPAGPPLAVLTAYAESAAALLAVELEHDGLPVDRDEAERLLLAAVGPRPADEQAERRDRARRDREVLALFPGAPEADLRNPAQVRALLLRAGIDVPDTRSWRLEPHRATSPAVAALLDWRRTERLTTTYGWGWLDRHVGADDRLRGTWSPADAAAGRMTASAGLHNLPAELRPMVAARPGWSLVRADLGQVEPRVLAVVSGDPGLAAAARAPDMYTPVATELGCDRPTAKVAVLAAMYGATSGTAAAALRRMEQAYPQALAHLREAERVGREGGTLRTWGGRLLRLPGGGSGRGARNAVVQGAAAELFKVWAATVRAGLAPLDGRVVLCLHDELLLHVPEQAAQAAEALLRDALREAAGRWAGGTGVRFAVEVGAARRWSDAKG